MLKINLFVLFLLSTLFQIHAEPLQGRKYGVEFNIPRVLAYSNDWKTMSGTFSYFDHKNKTEIAFPWFLGKYGSGDDALLNQSIDIHYRKFVEDRLGGLYLSAFSRLSNFDGAAYTNRESILNTDTGYYEDQETKNVTNLRFGVGVGIGFRLLPENKRMYWGSSLMIGRYFDSNENYTQSWGFFDDGSFILDAEILKFGYAF